MLKTMLIKPVIKALLLAALVAHAKCPDSFTLEQLIYMRDYYGYCGPNLSIMELEKDCLDGAVNLKEPIYNTMKDTTKSTEHIEGRIIFGKDLFFVYVSHAYIWQSGAEHIFLCVDSLGLHPTTVISKNESVSSLNMYDYKLEWLRRKLRKGEMLKIERFDGNMKKLMAKYKSKFGKPISEFERSIVNVSFETGTSDIEANDTERSYKSERIVYVDRDPIYGIRVQYINMYDTGMMELDVSEWLDFINTLYGYRIDEWETGHYKGSEPSTKDWKLTISFADGEERFIFGSSSPPNWKKFMNMIDDMEAKIKTEKRQQFKQREEKISHDVDSLKAEYEKIFELPQTGRFEGNMKNLKTEYKKRFGKPITSFESSIKQIYFKVFHEPNMNNISITRTANGAVAKHSEEDMYGAKLDMGEWMDFIKALNECSVSEWDSVYYDRTKPYEPSLWEIFILFSNRKFEDRYYIKRYSSHNNYPSNWEKFMTIMRYMEVKVKENEIKRGRLEIERLDNIKTEYEKKFKRPITDFELSITNVYFKKEDHYKRKSKYLESSREIFVTRTANGAVAKYADEHNIKEAKLNTSEWLDFINALREKFHDSWEKRAPKKLSEPYNPDYEDEDCSDCAKRELTIFFSDDKALLYEDKDDSGKHTFGKNMLSKIMDGMQARIKKGAAGK